MSNMTDYEENRILDLSWLTTDKLALMQVLGTESTTGTEVTGGSYARQTTSGLAAAASGSKATNAAITYTGMPATDCQGWAIFDTGGTNRKWYGLWDRKTGTAQATGDTITSTAHGYAADQKVVFLSGYAPAGLSANTTYFVRDVTTDTFKLAATAGGSAIDVTADSTLVKFGVVKSFNASDTFTIASGNATLSLD